MSVDDYLHKETMGNEAMSRSLYYQATAIWPFEKGIFEKHCLGKGYQKVLDLGCGTGEISRRMIDLFNFEQVLGLDLLPENVARAEALSKDYSGLHFEVGNAFETRFENNTFDLSLCRHVLQAVPKPEQLIKEMSRITKPNGRLYFLVEDYGMLFRSDLGGGQFWIDSYRYLEHLDTDLFIGRKMPMILSQLGFTEITCDYVTIDSLNTPKEVLVGMFQAWKDGYAGFMAEHGQVDLEKSHEHFQAYIDIATSEHDYVCWHIPIVTAVNI